MRQYDYFPIRFWTFLWLFCIFLPLDGIGIHFWQLILLPEWPPGVTAAVSELITKSEFLCHLVVRNGRKRPKNVPKRADIRAVAILTSYRRITISSTLHAFLGTFLKIRHKTSKHILNKSSRFVSWCSLQISSEIKSHREYLNSPKKIW